MKIKLRGHHLLCLQGFQGYGYDSNFIKNMTRINDLRKKDSTTILLQNFADEICKSCPNLKNNNCIDENHEKEIARMDNEILSKLNINKEYNSKEIFQNISNIFNTKKSIEKICIECKWHEECLFYQKLK